MILSQNPINSQKITTNIVSKKEEKGSLNNKKSKQVGSNLNEVTDDNSSDKSGRMITNKSSMSSLKIGNSTTTKLVTVEINVEVATPIIFLIVPITKFFPLISEIGITFHEIVEIVQAAEHNKRTCFVLLQLVHAVNLVVLELKVPRNNNQEFFNNRNYLYLQNLVNVITQMKKFTAEISQMKTLLKYIQAKSIEKTFYELFKELFIYIKLYDIQISC